MILAASYLWNVFWYIVSCVIGSVLSILVCVRFEKQAITNNLTDDVIDSGKPER